ncbi:MAG: hypothetical protein PF590_04460, partial [Candidatus Delongbacteria bacterium]|nr:hypothetical protein [Candidatus Delongbacteria bacterium]
MKGYVKNNSIPIFFSDDTRAPHGSVKKNAGWQLAGKAAILILKAIMYPLPKDKNYCLTTKTCRDFSGFPNY